MKTVESMGMAAAVMGLVLLTAAFAVVLAAPHGDAEIAGPFLVAMR